MTLEESSINDVFARGDVVVEGLLDLTRQKLGLDAMWISRPSMPGHPTRFASGDVAGEQAIADSHTHVAVPIRLPHTQLGVLHGVSSGPSAFDQAALVLYADTIARAMLASATSRDGSAHHRIRGAIDCDGITSVFQPVYAASSGRIVGVEALSRFEGTDPPNVWFEHAHSIGLGIELELAAIRAAVTRIDELPANTYIALNASSATILDPGLLELVASTGLAHRVVIELTEHEAVTDYDALLTATEDLGNHGIRFSVDDVGAGFSSFTHVLRLRPDIVKIDISLTRDNDTNVSQQGIIDAIVHTAHRIDATVTAEGVETIGEIRSLTGLGVTHLQGYALARPTSPPVPTIAERLVELPARQRRRVIDIETRELAAARFDIACQHSPIGIAIVEIDGRFRHANPRLCEILGIAGTELETMTFQDLTHPDDLHDDQSFFVECLDGRRSSFRTNKRYLHHDGTVVDAHLTVALVRSDVGDPLYFISQILPIVDRMAPGADGCGAPDQAVDTSSARRFARSAAGSRRQRRRLGRSRQPPGAAADEDDEE